MKLAVLSDVHGNVPALEAVLDDIAAWGAERVVVNGDLVNRGPYSLACLRLLQRRLPGCHTVKGNHEAFVIASADRPGNPAAPDFDIQRIGEWTGEQMGAAVDELRPWADHLEFDDIEGGTVHITHGSRLGNRDGIHAGLSDDELAAKVGDPRELFIASHTHRPLIRRHRGSLVVNVGSAGQPLDGNPRAAYGRFTLQRDGWHAEIARVAYDKARAERDFQDSGFLDGAGPLAQVIYLELRRSQPHVAYWRRQYMAAVMAGDVSVREAVRAYLEAHA